MAKINFNKIKFVHLIGIKGVGMTALAACLKDKGLKISGSDIKETFITDQTLKKMGLSWWEKFSPRHITDQDLVIATGSAHQGQENIEAKAALKKGLPYLTHGEALGALMQGKIGISVCGVGGKTTTSAMLATIMTEARLNPSFAIGAAEIFPLGLPGRFSPSGQFFIAEADEYATAKGVDNRPRFFWQNPKVIICTNIEYDHPDIYKNLQETKRVFQEFFQKVANKGTLIINADNKNNQSVIKGLNQEIITYGEGEGNDYQIKNLTFLPQKTIFSLLGHKKTLGTFELNVPGRHNVLNAAGAIIAARVLGASLPEIKSGLSSFRGTKRRFEFLGKTKDREIWDDYAHHPSQIKATLAAAKAWFDNQPLAVIFQPHTFSRTEELLEEFSESFSNADQVIILPVYSSGRETGDPIKTGEKLAQKISQHHQRVIFLNNKNEVKKMIKKINQKIIFTMGAGDVWKIGQELIDQKNLND